MTRTHAAATAALTALALAGCVTPDQDPASSTPASTPTAATVTIGRVLDGDTVDVPRAGRTERVRLLGIDAPRPHTASLRNAAPTTPPTPYAPCWRPEESLS